MSILESALSSSLSGLRAAQIGIDTTGQNIANSSIEGYKKRRVNLMTQDKDLGVDASIIRKFENVPVFNSLLTATEKASKDDESYGSFSEIDRAMASYLQGDQSLSKSLKEFSYSWHNLQVMNNNENRKLTQFNTQTVIDRLKDINNIFNNTIQTNTFEYQQYEKRLNEIDISIPQTIDAIREAEMKTNNKVDSDLRDQLDILSMEKATIKGKMTSILETNSNLRIIRNGFNTIKESFVNEVNSKYSGILIGSDIVGEIDANKEPVYHSIGNITFENTSRTFDDAVLNEFAKLGSITKKLSDDAIGSMGVQQSIEGQYKKETAVSLEEESVKLMIYRTMYEANVRVMNTQQSIFDALLSIKQ